MARLWMLSPKIKLDVTPALHKKDSEQVSEKLQGCQNVWKSPEKDLESREIFVWYSLSGPEITYKSDRRNLFPEYYLKTSISSQKQISEDRNWQPWNKFSGVTSEVLGFIIFRLEKFGRKRFGSI